MNGDFIVVLRGYDRAEVDRALGAAQAALADGDDTRRAAALAELRKGFTVALRGYDRSQVDNTVSTLVTALTSGARFRSALASALRLDGPSEQEILDEVRRLRELADRA